MSPFQTVRARARAGAALESRDGAAQRTRPRATSHANPSIRCMPRHNVGAIVIRTRLRRAMRDLTEQVRRDGGAGRRGQFGLDWPRVTSEPRVATERIALIGPKLY